MSVNYSVSKPSKNMGEAVRNFCLECMGSYAASAEEPEYRAFGEVRNCNGENYCSLWPYRFGKSPSRSAKAKARAAADPTVTEHLRRTRKPLVSQGETLPGLKDSPKSGRTASMGGAKQKSGVVCNHRQTLPKQRAISGRELLPAKPSCPSWTSLLPPVVHPEQPSVSPELIGGR